MNVAIYHSHIYKSLRDLPNTGLPKGVNCYSVC